MIKYLSLIWGLFISYSMLGQTEHQSLLDGTLAYEKGDFETATQNFEKAIEQNSTSLKGNFNLGNSLFKQQKYDVAATHYQNAIGAATDKKEKAQALYNLGNTRLAQAKASMQQQGQGAASLDEKGQEHLEEAIDAYKNALRNNAQDYDAKNNLATAYKLLRQQQEQNKEQNKEENKDQNKDENKDENKDKNEDQNKDEQDKKDQEDQQNDEKEDSGENPEENEPIDNDNPKDSENMEPKELSKDEVDRLLEIIEQDDKKVQEKLMKRKRSKTKKPEKAW